MNQFFWFLFVGSAGFLVDFATFNLLMLCVSVHIARALSFLVAVNITFILNRRLTFKNQRASYKLYVLGQCKGIILNVLIFELVLAFYDSEQYHINITAFALGSIGALIFNFLFAKNIVFKKTDS